MLPFFGTAAIVIAAVTAPSAPSSSDAARVAQTTAPITAPAPSRRDRRHQQAVNSSTSAPSADQQAIEEQNRLRVFFPALSGDGGG